MSFTELFTCLYCVSGVFYVVYQFYDGGAVNFGFTKDMVTNDKSSLMFLELGWVHV